VQKGVDGLEEGWIRNARQHLKLYKFVSQKITVKAVQFGMRIRRVHDCELLGDMAY